MGLFVRVTLVRNLIVARIGIGWHGLDGLTYGQSVSFFSEIENPCQLAPSIAARDLTVGVYFNAADSLDWIDPDRGAGARQ